MSHADTEVIRFSNSNTQKKLKPLSDSVRRLHPSGKPADVADSGDFSGMFQMDFDGFIFLHRRLRDHWISMDGNTLKVFIQILLRVEWKEGKTVYFNGAEVRLKQGEMTCGIHQMSKWASLSVRQTRTALNKLKSTNTVTIKSSNKFSILYLENWEKYQKFDKQTTSKLTNERQTSDKRATTLEEYNKSNNRISIISTPPTLNQCKEYFTELGHPKEADSFFDHFSANGWKVSGRAPMKDWRAAVRNWIRSGNRFGIIKIKKGKPDKNCSSCGGGGYAPGSGKECWCVKKEGVTA